MGLQGTTDSWNERIDHCLGQATRVLEHATDQFVEGQLDLGDAEMAATLAEAWRDLANTWADREEFEIEDEEMTDEPANAKA